LSLLPSLVSQRLLLPSVPSSSSPLRFFPPPDSDRPLQTVPLREPGSGPSYLFLYLGPCGDVRPAFKSVPLLISHLLPGNLAISIALTRPPARWQTVLRINHEPAWRWSVFLPVCVPLDAGLGRPLAFSVLVLSIASATLKPVTKAMQDDSGAGRVLSPDAGTYIPQFPRFPFFFLFREE